MKLDISNFYFVNKLSEILAIFRLFLSLIFTFFILYILFLCCYQVYLHGPLGATENLILETKNIFSIVNGG